MAKDIVIVDYGMGNVGSILNMLRYLNLPGRISRQPQDIRTASHLIIAGVGAFDHGMSRLKELDLIPLLTEQVVEREVPTLGICLGMQLLSRSSEEGILPGLAWIGADTKKFAWTNQEQLRIPHMGWNVAKPTRVHPLFEGLEDEARFYFVHSYHVVCDNAADTLATTNYGLQFTSVIARKNIMGVQFHPEKSHRFGMKLFDNFARIS